jgi:hypothetical protein
LAASAEDVDEHAVAALVVEAPDRFLENPVVVQLDTSLDGPLTGSFADCHSGNH